jgi:Ca-activated chloride channel family protein
MIRLADPIWLAAAALALPALGVWLLRRRWQRFPHPDGGRGRGLRRLLPAAVATASAGVLAAAAIVPLAVALARPQEVLSSQSERAEGIDMVVAMDISGSMAALDFEPTDRIGVAKEVIQSFLQERVSDRIGLVVFAGAAVTLCPITLDHEVAGELLEDVEIGALPDGTAIGMGLGTAVSRLRESDADSRVIILVTDGASNSGQLDPMTAADLAVEQGISVHTVLVGSGGVVPIPVTVRDPLTGRTAVQTRRVEVEVNPELLAEIARRTGGTAFRARDPEALRDVFAEIDELERTEFTSTRLVRYRERFEPWALAAAGLLLLSVAVESVAGRTLW